VLVLDTHVWVWSVDGDTGRIGRRTRQMLQRAQSRAAIRVSPMAVFELAALHTLGRVRLARSLDQWVRDALDAVGVRIAELTPGIALDAGAIPRAALADPLDRLLVATARQLDAIFLTSDRRILDYAATTGNVRVHDAAV
jgi:PIN domain nuclease of toxin-antitoxin system